MSIGRVCIAPLILLTGMAWCLSGLPATSSPAAAQTIVELLEDETLDPGQLLAGRSVEERLAVLRALAARSTSDATYQALGLVLELEVPADRVLLRHLVRAGLSDPTDAELVRRALALEARIDPARHLERVLELCRRAQAPVELLIGAVSSLEHVAPWRRERVLRALLEAQLADLALPLDARERAQREELALGALETFDEPTTTLLRAGQGARGLLAGLSKRQGDRQALYQSFTRMPHGLARWSVAEAFERLPRDHGGLLVAREG